MSRDAQHVTSSILLVEDEVFVRLVIADYLRGCGYKVIEAANGDEALIVLQHREIAVDLVFSDIELPGSMGGFELANWIREHRPDVDVTLTGNVPRAANAAAELCESGPLPKPYEAKVAEDRIKRLLALRETRKRK